MKWVVVISKVKNLVWFKWLIYIKKEGGSRNEKHQMSMQEHQMSMQQDYIHSHGLKYLRDINEIIHLDDHVQTSTNAQASIKEKHVQQYQILFVSQQKYHNQY